jgi:dTDP-4-dehydrorhamnose 3,5-epimerase
VSILNIKKIKNSQGDIFKILSKKDKYYKNFGECYISEIKPKKIKAWRYHKKNQQNIVVIEGKCKIVLLMNKKFVSYNLSSKNLKMLIIPKKIWYGFYNFTKNKIKILNIIDKIYNDEEVVRKEEKEMAYKW